MQLTTQIPEYLKDRETSDDLIFIYFFYFLFKKEQDATYTITRILFYTDTCTRRRAAASEHRTRNPTITSPMRYRYTNFVRT